MYSDDEAEQGLPLNAIRDAFARISTGPDALSIDGGLVDRLPNRAVTLGELREILLDRTCAPATRDAVWRLLIHRSRAEGSHWTIACAGVALPALAASTRQLGAWHAGEHADLQAAILEGFLHALAAIDTTQEALMDRLRWAAHRAGHEAAAESLQLPFVVDPDDVRDALDTIGTGFRSATPKPPWGHPDLVLARAVADSVITPIEAELIAATRMEEVELADWAGERAVAYSTANAARWRAEQRLVAYLSGETREPDRDEDILAAVEASVALADAWRPVDTTPDPSRAVSGRYRNGRLARRRYRSRSVQDSGPKSGLFRCRDFPPSTRATSPEPDSEDRRCA
jgi:hypothetical protein